jgi:hypothetical protein
MHVCGDVNSWVREATVSDIRLRQSGFKNACEKRLVTLSDFNEESWFVGTNVPRFHGPPLTSHFHP